MFKVAAELGWTSLDEDDLIILKDLHALMSPIADLLLKSQRNNLVISKLNFAILELHDTLDNIQVLLNQNVFHY